MRRRPRIVAGALEHRSTWASLGVTSNRLATDEFLAVFPGFHTPTVGPASLNALCHVLQNKVVPGAVLSHSTAAALWGIPVPPWIDDGVGRLRRYGEHRRSGFIIPSRVPVWSEEARRAETAGVTRPALPHLHCRVPRERTVRVSRGATVHRVNGGETTQWQSLVVSTPLETLLELAPMLLLHDLVAAIDVLIGPKSTAPGTTLENVLDFARSCAARRGAPRLRAAAARSRGGVESPGESLSRQLVVSAGFPEPVPNLRVMIPQTGRHRRIDNAFEHGHIGMEYDGDVHRVSQDRWRDDEARRDELATQGWVLRRSTGNDIEGPLSFLGRLRSTFLDRDIPAPPLDRIDRAARTWSEERRAHRAAERRRARGRTSRFS